MQERFTALLRLSRANVTFFLLSVLFFNLANDIRELNPTSEKIRNVSNHGITEVMVAPLNQGRCSGETNETFFILRLRANRSCRLGPLFSTNTTNEDSLELACNMIGHSNTSELFHVTYALVKKVR